MAGEILDSTVFEEKPTVALRWVRCGLTMFDLKLQQQWSITRYENGRPMHTRGEWRDVPTELNPKIDAA